MKIFIQLFAISAAFVLIYRTYHVFSSQHKNAKEMLQQLNAQLVEVDKAIEQTKNDPDNQNVYKQMLMRRSTILDQIADEETNLIRIPFVTKNY